MLDKIFGLLFYLKKPKNYEKGEIPIYLRIPVDGIPKEFSLKRCCDLSRWNPHAGRASGTKENVRTLNNYPDTYQAKVFEAMRKLVEENQMVTATTNLPHSISRRLLTNDGFYFFQRISLT